VAGKFTEPTLHQIGENGWRMVETKRLLKTTSSAIHEHSSSMRAQLLSNNVCPKRLSLPLLMTQAGQNVQSAATAESVASTQSEENLVFSKDVTAKIVAIVGSNTLSPLSATPWEEVMQHMAQRLTWLDSSFEMLVVTDEMFLSETCEQEDISADIAVIVGITSTEVVKRVQSRLVGTVPTLISFDSDPGVETWLGGLKFAPVDWIEKTLSALPGSKRAEAAKVMSIVTDAWERRNSDDYRFALLVLIDSYVTPVKLLKSLRATGLASVGCMIRNCRSQILACLLDPNCRQAINCLQSCGPTDQVCSYRCIVSNESPAFEAFTLCVLQKHNCLGLSAEITMQPDVQPLSVFRGAAIDHDVAEDLFIGWLGRPNLGLGMQKLDWSWRVVAGQNAAYDQFPSQYQMFYRGKAKGSMWYDPVFQVKTLDGPMVWRRRHYRVRRDKTPGTFYFTVLDNGVISKEFWRIVDVTDDLSWGLFYYSGAAEAAGQSYTGAIVVTPDGKWPAESENERLEAALERCGIKLWELYRVNNEGGDKPPLGIPEGSSLHRAIS